MARGNGRAGLLDPARKMVRITGERNGQIEFEFGMGDLALVIELIMPRDAFADFCAANAVTMLDPADAGEGVLSGDAEEDEAVRAMAWRPSDVQRKF